MDIVQPIIVLSLLAGASALAAKGLACFFATRPLLPFKPFTCPDCLRVWLTAGLCWLTIPGSIHTELDLAGVTLWLGVPIGLAVGFSLGVAVYNLTTVKIVE